MKQEIKPENKDDLKEEEAVTNPIRNEDSLYKKSKLIFTAGCICHLDAMCWICVCGSRCGLLFFLLSVCV